MTTRYFPPPPSRFHDTEPPQFLVAMNPTLRKKWAQRMAELITPGTGLLVCLEYPLFRPAESGGPPHGINSSDYDALLRKDFEKVMHYVSVSPSPAWYTACAPSLQSC